MRSPSTLTLSFHSSYAKSGIRRSSLSSSRLRPNRLEQCEQTIVLSAESFRTFSPTSFGWTRKDTNRTNTTPSERKMPVVDLLRDLFHAYHRFVSVNVASVVAEHHFAQVTPARRGRASKPTNVFDNRMMTAGAEESVCGAETVALAVLRLGERKSETSMGLKTSSWWRISSQK